MSCSVIFEELSMTGHTVRVAEDGRLAVGQGSSLTNCQRTQIIKNKVALVSFLSPSPDFGPQAQADAHVLVGLIDHDPEADLKDIQGRAADLGIAGPRWAFALVALPERLDQPKEKN